MMENFGKPTTAPGEYDASVRKTIPFYDEMQRTILDTVRALESCPKAWLDTGGGTGALVEKAMRIFPDTEYLISDPNEEMLAKAEEKFGGCEKVKLLRSTTEELMLDDGSFDVVTAMLAHHYLEKDEKVKAASNVFRMLRPGGVYFNCEHTAPESGLCRDTILSRWVEYQISMGKSPEKAESHRARYGVEYHPITVAEHVEMLKKAGFRSVDVIWTSYLQVMLLAVK